MNDNTQNSQGLACPVCQAAGAFQIIARAVLLVCDDGIKAVTATAWDDEAHCNCLACDHIAPLAAYRVRRA